MSAKAGWYPDPGGGAGLYRYWDGKAWSAATTATPTAAPPPGALGSAVASGGVSGLGGQPYGSLSGSGQAHQPYGTQGYAGQGYSGQPGGYPAQGGYPGQGGYPAQGGSAYANYQQQSKKKSPVGWWIGAGALAIVIIVVAVIAIRSLGGAGPIGSPSGGGGASQDVCPPEKTDASPLTHPADGRVHGGPVSYPELGSPWSAPQGDTRVPFGFDTQSQIVEVEPKANWVASILVAELAAGDGFFTPEQGAQIVVKCILGKFYGNNEVTSDVKVNQATTVDGHEGWLVESHLSFDIPDLETKGELLIVAIVSAGATAGLYYASIPDSVPHLVPAAREALQQLKVDG